MENKILNPKTNRYVLKTGKIGKELLNNLNKKKINCDKSKIKFCLEKGKICNSKTNRCINDKNKTIDDKNKMINIDIINNLKIIEEYEKILGNTFKANAYKKGINEIELLNDEITLDNYKNIKNIGKSIRDIIEEYIKNKKIKKIDDINNDKYFELKKTLNNIHGIGPVKIKALMEKISSIEELNENLDLLNEKQKKAFKYLKDLKERIPYSEGILHYNIITKKLKELYTNIEFDMVGSYRRKKKDMGDIDILIKNEDNIELNKIIDKLKENYYIKEILANGKKKFMGICKIDKLPARRIDILLTNKEHYYYTLLYFTGSYEHNIKMRKKALELGYSLSEYGLKNIESDKYIDNEIKSEKDIFKILNMEYVKPEDRI